MKRNGWNRLLVLQFVAGVLLFTSGLFELMSSDDRWWWNLLLLLIGLGAMALAVRGARNADHPTL